MEVSLSPTRKICNHKRTRTTLAFAFEVLLFSFFFFLRVCMCQKVTVIENFQITNWYLMANPSSTYSPCKPLHYDFCQWNIRAQLICDFKWLKTNPKEIFSWEPMRSCEGNSRETFSWEPRHSSDTGGRRCTKWNEPYQLRGALPTIN